LSKLIMEDYRAGEIPLLTISPAGANGCPIVFFCHGMFGDRRHAVEFGYLLARAGVFFAAFDPPMHGERMSDVVRSVGRSLPNPAYPLETGLDVWCLMLQVIVQANRDITTLVEHFRSDPRVDVGRVGVSGLSMGGYLAFYAAAHNPLVRAAVPAIGMPAFADRWADVVTEASSYAQWSDAVQAAQAETERRAAWIKEIDPLPRLASFCPRPLLMLTGDLDVDQPKSYSVKAFRSLQPLYAAVGHPERLKLSIHDGIAHRFSSGMMDEAVDWFGRCL
jgi:uncharacterized protein